MPPFIPPGDGHHETNLYFAHEDLGYDVADFDADVPIEDADVRFFFILQLISNDMLFTLQDS
jgi:hypothetical protein